MQTFLACLAAALVLLSARAAQDSDSLDSTIISRVRAEIAERSSIAENASTLTDVYGARLTGSESFLAAAEWARSRMQSYGASRVRLEPFPWGLDWKYSHFQARMTAPEYSELSALPMVYSAGTAGLVKADVVLAASADLNQPDDRTFPLLTRELKGRVRGKFVMLHAPAPARPVPLASQRLTEAELAALERAPAPAGTAPVPAAASGNPRTVGEQLLDFLDFLGQEKAAGVIWRSGTMGAISTATLSTTYRDRPAPLPIIYVVTDQYNRIARLLQRSIAVRLEINLAVTRSKSPVNGVNVIGEIPGNRKSDEIVMIGAHLDSWVGGTGATDNAAGCAVVMEVVRVLRALNLGMDRTVRFALWGGEEGAGLGAATYVRSHYWEEGRRKPEHAGLSAYFNIDNGSGKIRGVYGAGNMNAAPMFRGWFASLGDPDVRTWSALKASGILSSDENAFLAAGLPAFAFIQDPLDYARTRHTTLDTFDRLSIDDLKQAAAVIATFVHAAANRPGLVSRQ